MRTRVAFPIIPYEPETSNLQFKGINCMTTQRGQRFCPAQRGIRFNAIRDNEVRLYSTDTGRGFLWLHLLAYGLKYKFKLLAIGTVAPRCPRWSKSGVSPPRQ